MPNSERFTSRSDHLAGLDKHVHHNYTCQQWEWVDKVPRGWSKGLCGICNNSNVKRKALSAQLVMYIMAHEVWDLDIGRRPD